MANTIATNKLTDLVALRFLVNSGFVTVGAKEHFKDQMVGKRNGQVYTFVIRDAVDVGEGPNLGYDRNYDTYIANNGGAERSPNDPTIDTSYGDTQNANEKTNLVEREIKMVLRDFHASVATQAIEAVTDVNWDKEVAEPNGAKIANFVVRKAVSEAAKKPSVVIAGAGFQPLAEAAAHLNSISSDKMFGFIDPKIQAILTANGQQFQPVGSPDSFYKSGLLGTFHSVEYRGQRFFNTVRVTAGSAVAAGCKFTSYTPSTKTLVVTLTDTTDSSSVIKAGTPIWIDGVMAADLIGDPTSEKYAFIAAADATASSGVFSITVTEDPAIAKGGTAEAVLESGAAIAMNGSVWSTTSVPTTSDVTIPENGVYFMGQVRLDGAYEFCTLDKLDASNADSKLGAVEGVKVHENRVVDLNNLTSKTRWDIVALFGVIERRGVVQVMIKA